MRNIHIFGVVSATVFCAVWSLQRKPKFGRKMPASWIFWSICWAAEIINTVPFNFLRRKVTLEELCQKAIQETGLHDFGDGDLWKKAVQRYVDDLWDNASRDSPIARLSIKKIGVDLLSKRLYYIDALKRFPKRKELPPTFFIVGMPRTGSTILHQILSQDPHCRSIKNWEWMGPAPPPEGQKDRRLEKAKEFVNQMRSMLPLLERIHLTEAEEADECYQGWVDFPFAIHGACNFRFGTENTRDLFWNSDLSILYQREREILQMILAFDDHSPDWMVLKCPFHTILLDKIHAEFKGTTFIWTHRDMKSVTRSFTGLFFVATGSCQHGYLQVDILARRALNTLTDFMTRGLELRESLEKQGVRFIDFYFSDFMDNPMNAIENLYRDLMGLGVTEEAKEKMLHFYQESLEKRKKDKKPFRFTLEDLNLTAEEIDEQFQFYYSRFPKVKH